jgi:hypothetical protein
MAGPGVRERQPFGVSMRTTGSRKGDRKRKHPAVDPSATFNSGFSRQQSSRWRPLRAKYLEFGTESADSHMRTLRCRRKLTSMAAK